MGSDRWGVTDGYWDVHGTWHATSPATTDALHQAMGVVDGGAPGPEPAEPLWFIRAGDAARLLGPCELTLEDGSDLGVVHRLPADLPLGDHRLAPCDGGPVTHLVVTPAHCHVPDGLRTWGWTAQLYATRSAWSWGHGDLTDLRDVAAMAASQGAGFVAINPLHACRTTPAVEPSPYYPSSRVWRNPLYVRVEEVDGFANATGQLADELRDLAVRGRALNAERLLAHDRVWELKGAALESLWSSFDLSSRRGEQFAAWRAEQGAPLQSFATFCALQEHHRTPWPTWAAEHRHPDVAAVRSFASEHEPRVAFHAWLQWLLAEQLHRASTAVPILADLAVGFDPLGADAWRWQDALALDARIGAPPDEFNADGQDWGTPPFIPAKLRAAHYAPWREVLDALCQPGGALRIDHVMGLFRLFWVPADTSPREGAYVRFAGQELLDLVALASARRRTTIVGEDLGTVEDEVRAALAERHVLSTRVVWFETAPPAQYPQRALASISTHDLPTVAGLLNGDDAADRARAGLAVDSHDDESLRAHLAAVIDGGEKGPGGDRPLADPLDAARSACEALSRAPAALVAASLDDALGVTKRPNLPGTSQSARPNWRIGLPVRVHDLPGDVGVRALAEALASDRPRSDPPSSPPQVTQG